MKKIKEGIFDCDITSCKLCYFLFFSFSTAVSFCLSLSFTLATNQPNLSNPLPRFSRMPYYRVSDRRLQTLSLPFFQRAQRISNSNSNQLLAAFADPFLMYSTSSTRVHSRKWNEMNGLHGNEESSTKSSIGLTWSLTTASTSQSGTNNGNNDNYNNINNNSHNTNTHKCYNTVNSHSQSNDDYFLDVSGKNEIGPQIVNASNFLKENSNLRNEYIVISGPTGVGKSALAMELCKRLDGEIISVDSVQVYKKLDIGSNKPSKEEQDAIPHHLIDLVDAREDRIFSAGEFLRNATNAILDVRERDKVPIVVGGTMMYTNWLVKGKPDAPKGNIEVERKIKEEIKEYENRNDWEGALSILASTHPERAAKIAKNDFYRLTRAIEVVRTTCTSSSSASSSFPTSSSSSSSISSTATNSTSTSLSTSSFFSSSISKKETLSSGEKNVEDHKDKISSAVDSDKNGEEKGIDYSSSILNRNTNTISIPNSIPFTGERVISRPLAHLKPRCFFLMDDRSELFHRIDSRCLDMLEGGLLKETCDLLIGGFLRRETSGGRAIGYRQAIEFLTSEDGFLIPSFPINIIEKAEVEKINDNKYSKDNTDYNNKDGDDDEDILSNILEDIETAMVEVEIWMKEEQKSIEKENSMDNKNKNVCEVELDELDDEREKKKEKDKKRIFKLQKEKYLQFVNSFLSVTRRYAKAQQSWFRNDPDTLWIRIDEPMVSSLQISSPFSSKASKASKKSKEEANTTTITTATEKEDRVETSTSGLSLSPSSSQKVEEVQIEETPIEYIERCFNMNEEVFDLEIKDVEGKQQRIKEKNRLEGKAMRRYQTYSELYDRIQAADILEAFAQKKRLWRHVYNLERKTRRQVFKDLYLNTRTCE